MHQAFRSLRRPFVAAFALAALVLPEHSAAQVQRPHEHEGGILIRLSAGLGPTKTTRDYDSGEKFEMKRVGGEHNLAIGGIVTHDLALHATWFGWTLRKPSYDLDGQDQQDLDGTVALNALGGGATWYFSEMNFYLSGSVGVAWLSFSGNERTLDTSTGGAIDLTLGKEWWASDRWGLGVAVGLQGFKVPSSEDDDWSGGSVAVRFSATFN